MKLVEVKTAKEFASTFFGDPVLKMAVNSVLDNAPGFELVHCKDCWKSGEGLCSYQFKNVPGKDFCGDGERK